MKLSDMSEGELVARFKELLPQGNRTIIGIGDDCAQVAAPEGSFVVTTDVIVQDQHFHLYWSTGYEVGARVAAQNLADVAAMGARPSALVVSVVAPRDMDAHVFLDIVRGMGERARQAGAGVVGGDMSAGEKLSISITAFGYCPGPVVRRDGARPGDILALSGQVGFSYAGLDLLSEGRVPLEVRGEELGELAPFLEGYRAPRPPLELGPLCAAAGAHAMMDLSDGVATDGGRMAEASGVVIELDRVALEREAALLAPAARVCGVDPLIWVVQGGEDHGMLAAFPPDATLPEGMRVCGRVRALEGDEVPHIALDGQILHGSWDHFSSKTVQ